MNLFNFFSKAGVGFLIFVGLVFGGSLQADSMIDRVIKRGTIKVGFGVFKPWAFRGKNGKYIGYEIDVMSQLAKDLGVKLQLVPTAWDGIIPALQTGKIDVIISGMSIKTKRNLKVNFTIGYDSVDYVLVANSKYANTFKTIESFNSRGVTVAARRGSIPADMSKNLFPKAKLRQFDDDGISVQEVVNSKAHITIETTTAAQDRLKAHPKKLYLVEEGKILGGVPSAMAIKKGDVDALNVLNNWITLYQQNGWLKNRNLYWFHGNDWENQ